MNIGSDILKERDKINETTAMAHETTLLNPRFYTTNFKEMDSLNVNSVLKRQKIGIRLILKALSQDLEKNLSIFWLVL